MRDATPEWRVLNDADGARLILAAARINSLDCSRVSAGEPFRDYWGGPLQVAVRRASRNEMWEVRISSDGPDGLPGTADDVIYPWGEEAVVLK